MIARRWRTALQLRREGAAFAQTLVETSCGFALLLAITLPAGSTGFGAVLGFDPMLSSFSGPSGAS